MLALKEKVIKTQRVRNKAPIRQRLASDQQSLNFDSAPPEGPSPHSTTAHQNERSGFPFPLALRSVYPSPEDQHRSFLPPLTLPPVLSNRLPPPSSYCFRPNLDHQQHQAEELVELDYYGLATPVQSPELGRESRAGGKGKGEEASAGRSWGFESGLVGEGEILINDDGKEEEEGKESVRKRTKEKEETIEELGAEGVQWARRGSVSRGSLRVDIPQYGGGSAVGSGGSSRMSARECWEGASQGDAAARRSSDGEMEMEGAEVVAGDTEGAAVSGTNDATPTLVSRLAQPMDQDSTTPPFSPPLLHPSLPPKPTLLARISIPQAFDPPPVSPIIARPLLQRLDPLPTSAGSRPAATFASRVRVEDDARLQNLPSRISPSLARQQPSTRSLDHPNSLGANLSSLSSRLFTPPLPPPPPRDLDLIDQLPPRPNVLQPGSEEMDAEGGDSELELGAGSGREQPTEGEKRVRGSLKESEKADGETDAAER